MSNDVSNEIEGWFLPEEGRWYAEQCRQRDSGIVIEVGSWKGRSACFLGAVLNKTKRRVFLVDDFSGSRDRYSKEYDRQLEEAVSEGSSVEEILRRNLNKYSVPYELLRNSSAEAAKLFTENSASVILIDASHDEDSVMSDLKSWWPIVRDDGILAGHDYSLEFLGLMKSVHRFSEEMKRPLLRGPGSLYYFEKDEEKYHHKFG